MKAGKPTMPSVVYVERSLTMHNPLFFLHKLWLNKLMRRFLLVDFVQNDGNAIEHCARSGHDQNKQTKTYNKEV